MCAVQVAASCGAQCAQVMQYTYAAIDAMLQEPQRNAWVKAKFAADPGYRQWAPLSPPSPRPRLFRG